MTKNPESWGKPLGALLGALKMQVELGLPSIGGKDSMSGTFQHINVPPMLMAFGITTVDAGTVISTDFKKAGSRIYLVRHTPKENYMPDTAQLKANFGFVSGQIESGKILSAWSVGFGGVAEGLAKMAFGNRIGAEVTTDESRLYEYAYGSILVESDGELDFPAAELLGATVADEAPDRERRTDAARRVVRSQYREIHDGLPRQGREPCRRDERRTRTPHLCL